MTTQEKLKRIKDLEEVKSQYRDALEVIQGKGNTSYDRLKYTGLVPKLLYMLKLKTMKEVEYDYSHNVGDDELKGIIVIYMERKIAECDTEINGYFCDDEPKTNLPAIIK